MSRQETVVDHPLVHHKLTLMRMAETPTSEFRQLLHEIGLFIGYKALENLPIDDVTIKTPVAPMTGKTLANKKLCLISVLRAGDGLLRPLMELVPAARVGHIGLRRNEETLMPEEYLIKLPDDMAERTTLVLDPMLATGNSAVHAVDVVKKAGAKDIRFVCLLAAPEGIERLHSVHPDVPVITGAKDSHLNEKGYIVPGLGDAGDRLFGTKG